MIATVFLLIITFLALLSDCDAFTMSSMRRQNSKSLLMAEKTYIMIKPDGVQRGVVGNIISRYFNKINMHFKYYCS